MKARIIALNGKNKVIHKVEGFVDDATDLAEQGFLDQATRLQLIRDTMDHKTARGVARVLLVVEADAKPPVDPGCPVINWNMQQLGTP